MSWEDFERLVSEYFRRNGFQVTREGGNGPDGGIDLVHAHEKRNLFGPVQAVEGIQGGRSASARVLRGDDVAGGCWWLLRHFWSIYRRSKGICKGLNLVLVDGREAS